MQMVKKSGIVLIVAWFAILVLMPKQEFYYKLEEALSEQEIELNEEKIEEGLFSLNLHQVTVYFKGIPVATIEEMDLCTLLFYSSLELQGLHVDDSLKRMVPQETQKALLSHSILSPLKVSVDAEGSFGGMTGEIDLNARTVHLDFNESKDIEMLKPQLKKSEKGWFYETSF
ncbi:hypothetical protein [Sulfurovum sp. TSL1]|uniref:hypothetical protein n=1 Tax=Sulfurovum sp. TSL1 TaxID=2826994 RepID=UPI001CC489F1|nr:hypothetical protein [Sulfurovum sp. TSL1]GIT98918.1 hypothetical protein TSL1_17390 [Sulfurovum sp. TSL1]